MATLVGSLAENTDTNTPAKGTTAEGRLVSWVMETVNPWRDDRNQQYERLWGEYWRLWRGRHTPADKTRKSERSKIVNPALAQALEITVAELEEASFGREGWIDILDDRGDPDHSDTNGKRQQFLEDLEKDNVPDSLSACYLNGGIWGTLAGKVVVESQTVPTIITAPDDQGNPQQVREDSARIAVKLVPIPVMNLIPDPDGELVEDMLGIAHEVAKPRAWLLRTKWGLAYAKRGRDPGAARDVKVDLGDMENLLATDSNQVLITEYHGLVPKRLLDEVNGNLRIFDVDLSDPLAEAEVHDVEEPEDKGLDDDGDMIESIVTIMDKTELGRAIENPFLLRDRSIVACQFEKVPNLFFGRGVMEKGYNPQKALDAEVRTRMDVMALIANPMMGADATALPKGFDMTVRPGKTWLTNGNPKEALFPVQFPNLDPASFSQSGEMERMVQVGTGAMDTATPIDKNPRNDTATGSSLIAGTFVKRAKRSLRAITNGFVNPVIQKILYRRMQYDSKRYPADFEFRIASTLGIVARELEQIQMTQMLGVVEQGSQTQGVLIQSIFDASSSPYKAELNAALQADSQPSPEQQEQAALQKQAVQVELQTNIFKMQGELASSKKTESEILLNLAKIKTELSKPNVEAGKLQLAADKLQVELLEVQEFANQNKVALLKVMKDTRGNNGQTTSN